MMRRYFSLLTAAAAGLLFAADRASAQLIVDRFEVNSAGSYTIVDDSNGTSGDGTADSTSNFNFDYIAAGLPLAPNSVSGETGGLRFAVNETAGEVDHITAYHNTSVLGNQYTLQVDFYMRVEAAAGTTEFATVGVAGNSSDFNSIFTPIAGSGHFISITGEGGSSSDYRHFIEPGTPVNSGDASYLNSDNTTNATGDTYQAIFPSPPSEFPGSPGNQWATLTIEVTPSTVTYAINGTDIIQTATVVTDGLVSLGYNDLFTSVGPHYVVYDNLSVTVIPEPASLALLGLAGLTLARRRR